MNYISGVSEISSDYDAFILDIWGVLHDGTQTYPGVIECLQQLRKRGKNDLLLSNSGRRAQVVSGDLKAFGIVPDIYSTLVTSGDFTHRSFKDSQDGKLLQLGTSYYLIGSEGYGLTEGLNLRRVELAEAEFLLALSIAGNPSSTAPYEDILAQSLARGLTMVCANPDILVSRNGVLGIGPGALADHYKKLGGQVIYFGKPFRPIFEWCLELLKGIERERIVMVGDSLLTDITGAQTCGLDTILVGTGIHAREMNTIPDSMEQLETLCRGMKTYPTRVAKGFRW